MECWVRTAGDGSSRCLPYATARLAGYRDAGCTEAIAWESGGINATPYVSQKDLTVGCFATMPDHIYTKGEIITKPHLLYHLDRGVCKPRPMREAANPKEVYAVMGPEVPASAFVKAAESLE